MEKQDKNLTREVFDAVVEKAAGGIMKNNSAVAAYHAAAAAIIFEDGVATPEECREYWAELVAIIPEMNPAYPF